MVVENIGVARVNGSERGWQNVGVWETEYQMYAAENSFTDIHYAFTVQLQIQS